MTIIDRAVKYLPKPDAWQANRWVVSLGVLILFAIIVFHDGSWHLFQEWQIPEFSHGPLIPVISLFLIWRSREAILDASHNGQMSGVAIIVASVLFLFLGELSTIYSVLEFALVLAIIGLFYCFIGHGGMFFAIGPLIHLFLMIPIPDLVYNSVSQKLQLISSALGVALIRLFNIPVFLEGNMIDLGELELQVAEACNGLRYVYPLASIAYVIAFSFKGSIWQKILIIVSSIPLAILMNSFRIGATGLLVDAFGIEAAKGFLHYFEGWVVFLLCLIVLFGFVALLGITFGSHRKLIDCFNVEPIPAKGDKHLRTPIVAIPRAAIISAGALAAGFALMAFMPERVADLPPRKPLVATPMQIGDWRGKEVPLNPAIVKQLRVTDYLLADYTNTKSHKLVQFYVSYYDSQRKGAAVHSPAACIPAGGWEIEAISHIEIAGAGRSGEPLFVNRVLISKEGEKQLVYYWFDQRGHPMTSAFHVKWSILWDALTKGRTDGAMLRLVTPILRGESVADVDERLGRFTRHIYPSIGDSLPQ